MNDFTPWTLLVDIGIVSILLLVGKLLRVKVRWIQQLFIPPSLLAGFIGLALGGYGLDWLPISNQTGTYAGILIAFVFATLPFTAQRKKRGRTSSQNDPVSTQKGSTAASTEMGGTASNQTGVSSAMGDRASAETPQTGVMWAYSQAGMLLQWALGGFLGLFVLNRFWPLDSAFGITMPAGFSGGHGTAAAVGQAFGAHGHEDILTLAMTAATFGILSAVVIGLVLVKWGARRGHTSFLTSFEQLPPEFRTGLLPLDKQESMGRSTLSPISMDSFTFYFALLCVAALGGYGVSRGVNYLLPMLELPVFSCAFVVALLLKKGLDRAKVDELVCKQTMGHIGGTLTDYLVAFGIASIKLSVVWNYFTPLVILLLCGLLFTLLYVFVVGRKLMKSHWFEKSLFTWGWFMGTMAMGIALLRVVDPKMQSRCLDSYALAYLFIAPVEIAIITLAPVAFLQGYGWLFSGVCLVGALTILATAYFKGWHKA